MDYDGRFIMQKTMVSANRPVDWSLLKDEMTIPVSACALPNYHRIIHKNVIDKPNDQSKACLDRNFFYIEMDEHISEFMATPSKIIENREDE